MSSLALAARTTTLLQRLQQGISLVELVYTPHDHWPYPRPNHRGHPHSSAKAVLRVSVLDSSFNPPTLAHLALANAHPPKYSSALHTTPHSDPQGEKNYDAKLLLLSVRNVDKALKLGDATHVQRLEMMTLLATENIRQCEHGALPTGTGHDDHCRQDGNVAVAIIDEPTFVGKSSKLLSFLRERLANTFSSLSSSPSSSRLPIFTQSDLGTTLIPKPQLTFLQGFDTLERLFSPRYYSSEDEMLRSLRNFFSVDGDDSRVVCARRASGSRRDSDEAMQQEMREQRAMEAAKEFMSSERVMLIDIGDDVRTISSTEVRDKISKGDEEWRRLVPQSIAKFITEEHLYNNPV